ncbi:MAG: hypothetical protein K5865_01060 [Eubacterium sp.]|nr:hypothetical protein [Eubacterium sp.]
MKSKRAIIKSIERSAGGRLFTAFLVVMCFLCIIMGSNEVRAEFIYKPVDALITFNCNAISGIDNNEYKISLKTDNKNAPLPEKDTVVVDKYGKGEFVIRVNEPGTYDYLIYQIKGSDNNIIYDDTKYEVHVCVLSDENGKLGYSVSVNIADTDEKPENIEFKNIAGSDRTLPDNGDKKPEDGQTTEEGKTSGDSKTLESNNSKVTTGDSVSLGIAIIFCVLSFAFSLILVVWRNRKKDIIQ